MTLSFNQNNNGLSKQTAPGGLNNPFLKPSPNDGLKLSAFKAQLAQQQSAKQANNNPQNNQLAAFAKALNQPTKASTGLESILPQFGSLPTNLPANSGYGAVPMSASLNNFMGNPQAMDALADILGATMDGEITPQEAVEELNEEMRLQKKAEKYERQADAWRKTNEKKIDQLVKDNRDVKVINEKLIAKKNENKKLTEQQAELRKKYEQAGLNPDTDQPEKIQAQINKVMAGLLKGEMGATKLLGLMAKLRMVQAIDPNNEWEKLCQAIAKNEVEQSGLRSERIKTIAGKISDPPKPDSDIADRVSVPDKQAFVENTLEKFKDAKWY